MRDLHKQITDTIIKQLENGTAPWRKPWAGGSLIPFTMPVNGTTSRKYRGINPLLLWSAVEEKGFTTHEWASFKQWAEKGEFVRKGEKGTLIVFWSTFEKIDEKSGEMEEIPFLKSSIVFNRCQLASYDAASMMPAEKPSAVEAIANADAFVAKTGAKINHNGNSRAFYRHAPADEIYMPKPDTFTGTETQSATEAYYSTLLHELSHWTGAESRLNRVKGKRFGDHAYAMEELIAEMSAAFLCAELSIQDAPRPDHASYLAEWLKVLKEDKKALLSAASMATKACDYLIELQSKEETQKEESSLAPIALVAAGNPAKMQQASLF